MTTNLAPADGLRGCIPIVCTPFNEDGSLDLPSLEQEVDWLIAEGASGVATLAIASEGYKLTENERDEVLRTVVKATRERVPVIASADGAGTEVALDRARRVAKLGADAVMVLPPYFVKPDSQALADYYLRIAAAGGIPVIIQDAPQLTGVAMTPAFWAQLANEASLIQYVKVEGNPQGPANLRGNRRQRGQTRGLLRLGRPEHHRRAGTRRRRQHARPQRHPPLLRHPEPLPRR